MELLYSITTNTMSVWTHERKPVLNSEAVQSYIDNLERCQVRRRSGTTVQYVFRFSRFSKSKRKEQLTRCKEVQARMDFNDTARNAISDEGVYMANQRHRMRQRQAIGDGERKQQSRLDDIDKESDDDHKDWSKAKKLYHREIYRPHQKAMEALGSGSPDPSESESEQDGSVQPSEPEEEPQPRRRASRSPRRRKVDPRRDGRSRDQDRINDAIEYLRSQGIETVTPNGGK